MIYSLQYESLIHLSDNLEVAISCHSVPNLCHILNYASLTISEHSVTVRRVYFINHWFPREGVVFVTIPARVDLPQPVGSRVEHDTLTPNRIADRTSRTTETSRSNRRPKRSQHAPRMRASDIRPHRPSRRTSPGSPAAAAASSFVPSSFAFTSARNLSARGISRTPR